MATRSGDITQGFTKVDQAADPRFFIEFLDARKTIEGEREVKELILEMLNLQPGARVLDVGCGTGDDARELAERVQSSGKVIGIDLSEALVAESMNRSAGMGLPVEFRLGDVRHLDFPDASFDSIRTDRVLMFVPEIETAIAEMVRVLCPGGRIVASELDHELRFIDSRLPEINRKIHSLWVASNPQPSLGRQLARLFAAHGLSHVKSVPRILKPPYQFLARVNRGFLGAAVSRGELDQAEVGEWFADLAELDQAGMLTNGIVAFTVSGEKRA
jgi:ubiquinone/menaquinone biosynthesis C-methylase UbiE